MFKIGDFSKIAQISGRMLRHYDKIGLFTPEYTDPETGYRYYTANQLPRLNRILALKDMGLGLKQIKELMHDDISADDIESLLYAQKSQIEQTIMADMARLRRVEFRIRQLKQKTTDTYDIVLKSVPKQNYFSTRRLFATKADSDLIHADIDYVQRETGLKDLPITAILHNDVFEDELDWEVGFTVEDSATTALAIPDTRQMCLRELPAVSTMATTIQDISKLTDYIAGYNAIGTWIEGNGYQIAGPVREVGLDVHSNYAPSIFEIQIPIEKITT